MQKPTSGVLYALSAYLMWGLFPLYWKALASVECLEILAHRIVWSVPFLFSVVLVKGQATHLYTIFGDRKSLLLVSASTVLIGISWITYIWSVLHNHTLEATLGYFVSPLLSVALGVLVLKESLSGFQKTALFVAAASVLYYACSLGQFPWIAVTLATALALYGFVKKCLSIEAAVSLTLETLVLSGPAAAYLLSLNASQTLALRSAPPWIATLLIGSGLVTSLPLLFYGKAAQHLPLSHFGFLQYLSPSIAFLISVFVFREPFGKPQLFTFIGVSVAVALTFLKRLAMQGKCRESRSTRPCCAE
ncbi:MAG: EamA family transporter RarD [Deltaproteobacteria bacterium]|nr:EamA family transporter RarD [Deltaproteobacteria bacterium]